MTHDAQFTEYPDIIAVSGYEIPASLTLPALLPPDAAVPSAILLVPGSLYSDVNGDYPTWNSFPHVYAHLAHRLAAHGHAVYRFAKLGPGTGSVAVDPTLAANVRTWEGRATIARAALDAMRSALATRGVRADRVIAAGHSEGSVVVSRLAVSDRGADLDGVVLLAGPSVGILEIMREQNSAMVSPEMQDDAPGLLDDVIAYVRRGERPPAELAGGPQFSARRALVNMPDDALRYMREVDATDPLALAGEMTQPVLVVQGGNDTSVPTHHGEHLRDALLARPRGAERTRYVFVPDVTHMFKIVPPEVAGPAAFGYPGETDARVTDGVDAWIRHC